MNNINKLRELRNECYKQWEEYQKQIDDLVFKEKGFDKLMNQYIKYSEDTDIYMYISSMTRLTHGCRLYGSGFEICDEYLIITDDLDIEIDDRDKVMIITETEFDRYLNEFFKKHMNKIHDNIE